MLLKAWWSWEDENIHHLWLPQVPPLSKVQQAH